MESKELSHGIIYYMILLLLSLVLVCFFVTWFHVKIYNEILLPLLGVFSSLYHNFPGATNKWKITHIIKAIIQIQWKMENNMVSVMGKNGEQQGLWQNQFSCPILMEQLLLRAGLSFLCKNIQHFQIFSFFKRWCNAEVI